MIFLDNAIELTLCLNIKLSAFSSRTYLSVWNVFRSLLGDVVWVCPTRGVFLYKLKII